MLSALKASPSTRYYSESLDTAHNLTRARLNFLASVHSIVIRTTPSTPGWIATMRLIIHFSGGR